MSRAADYVPYRFYRICPEDSHTCVDRECLVGNPACPKVATKGKSQSQQGAIANGGVTAPGTDWDWCDG